MGHVAQIAASFFTFSIVAFAQTPIKFLIVTESTDVTIKGVINEVLAIAEKDFGGGVLRMDAVIIEVNREDLDSSLDNACAAMMSGITMLLDLTWTGWEQLQKIAASNTIIYRRGELAILPYIQALDDLLTDKNATDMALIFENEQDLNQSLYYLIGESIIRLVVIDELSDATIAKIRAVRPSPSYYAIFATTDRMEYLFKTALDGGLVRRNGTWYLLFTDRKYQNFKYISGGAELNVTVDVITMSTRSCCQILGQVPCKCPDDFQVFPHFVKRLIGIFVATFAEMIRNGVSFKVKSFKCEIGNTTNATHPLTKAFNVTLAGLLLQNDLLRYEDKYMILAPRVTMEFETLKDGNLERLGNWTQQDRINLAPGKQNLPAKRYFRVGTTEAVPWSSIKRDPVTGLPVKDSEGKDIWEGYCIDFIKELSVQSNFDYDLVIPEDMSFGEKLPNGKWTGLVGDLARGETDIVVAALTMTSEREEVIDFVAPYFAQSGILIVMRKPSRKTSLFKFMTVLRLEVWLSIVGALTLTGIMIWILDKYSPYSARNNKKIYPYPCREFTLKESFWFALTSFTPQGGGEAPKALSSRTLVAAYWLFVVLMLATFTANLAAFLTVERMQSPVQSLEQLARQSRINYTVLANSTIHQYFTNMKNAEDKLYNVWKEITLNSTSDQIEYRVWDYPIKEQYGHILLAISQVGPVKTAEEGFRKVLESDDAEFAFIHDSAEIKYQVTRDCNLTEVGEVFAEQPYAIAVQQGSHLQEEISRRILDLQKARYFERLAGEYWNSTLKNQCQNVDDNEGITLESLGGVFIATLFGLALAMITLAGEVIYYRRRNSLNNDNKSKEAEQRAKERRRYEKSMMDKITENLKMMKPAPSVGAFVDRPLGPRPRVSHISVYPRNFPFKE
ncbi:glutamate receptor ionotropic, NMDA 2A-like isoform X2 [Venturia canescens]|uniref:glutamate receptor ionotropic, NMDA 2A-like isoform X2 n=1 Tax=Venturia canescens TaxID=32260 RepID=UPI001C9D2307|nr:glutamate receptor ionotropic, NMDA 2A-like isoform X2 [Venturia canescens]